MSAPWLGIIADDVTGATDVAAAVREAGHTTVLRLGVPERSEPLPACDVLAELVASWSRAPPLSVGTPATPAARRTQYQGHLFVGDRLLSESSLRHHPLTPMADPDLVRVLAAQTATPARLVRWGTVQAGPEAVRLALHEVPTPAHVLVDALTEADLDTLAQALLSNAHDEAPLPAVAGGGAGLAGALARARPARTDATAALPAVPAGQRLIVSGSLSDRTREQLAAFSGTRVDIDPLAGGRDQSVIAAVRLLREAYERRTGAPVLVVAPTDAVRVRAYQDRLGRDAAGRLVSGVLAEIAARATRDLGVRRLVVAGGETSGEVTRALGIRSLHVGESVSRGVPWTVATGPPPQALLLKSGNFGQRELFDRAWDLAP